MKGTLNLVMEIPIEYDSEEYDYSESSIKDIIYKNPTVKNKITHILEDGWEIIDTFIE